ncbi:MAG: NAD(P)-dependent oxidoreductase [Rhodospirillaceae bacterium]|jgi:3-hydroxyisobutyrate dehydrogenase-like beta-hydroxyacid dehydrogenase|nr:NAD(P)-dependent oxidoreductase [Rhodospirillaceae bacterium]MBT6140178.1 NAD(P)-dependent oxidoreductase [Rhodospirillaceae bacterium]
MPAHAIDLTGQTVGLVGLGLMGLPMAGQLRAAGAELVLWNRSKDKAVDFADRRSAVTVVDTPREVAEKAGSVIVMLANADAVEDVIFGADGLIEGIGQDSLVVEMGTTTVLRMRDFADRVRVKGADWVDAPVSGGTGGAEAGTLTIMAGGSDASYHRAEPLFQAMGESITHVGASGSGQIAKSANQMIVGLTIEAVAEAFTMASAAGVDPAKVREAIMGGFAQSKIMDLHGERMLSGEFRPGHRCVAQDKDMREAVELARSLDLTLPGLEASLPLWRSMVDGGMGDLDHSGLIKTIDPKAS